MTEFSPKQLNLLRNLGFLCWEDPSNCSLETVGALEESSQDKKCIFPGQDRCTKNPEPYVQAFRNLASVGKGPWSAMFKRNIIDRSDLEALSDPQVVGVLLEKDPVYKIMARTGKSITFGSKEVGNAINQREQRRVVAYVQMALNEIFKDEIAVGEMEVLEIDGDFGSATKTRLAIFQKQVDMSQNDGALLGRDSLAHLILRMKYSKKEIVDSLMYAQFFMKGEWMQMEGVYKSTTPQGFAQDAITLSFKYLGYFEPRTQMTSNNMRIAMKIIQRAFKASPKDERGPDRVGSVVISRIRTEVEKTQRFGFREE